MRNIEELKKLKASLEERRSSVAAEQKFLEAEKKRVMEKLKSFGFNSLSELKEAKEKLEAQIAESQKKLDEDLARLESADKETLEVPAEKPEAQQAPTAQPEVAPTTAAPSSFASSILDDII